MKLTQKFNYLQTGCRPHISYCFTVNSETPSDVEVISCNGPYPHPPTPFSVRCPWPRTTLNHKLLPPMTNTGMSRHNTKHRYACKQCSCTCKTKILMRPLRLKNNTSMQETFSVNSETEFCNVISDEKWKKHPPYPPLYDPTGKNLM